MLRGECCNAQHERMFLTAHVLPANVLPANVVPANVVWAHWPERQAGGTLANSKAYVTIASRVFGKVDGSIVICDSKFARANGPMLREAFYHSHPEDFRFSVQP
jgi:hypothetical protein